MATKRPGEESSGGEDVASFAKRAKLSPEQEKLLDSYVQKLRSRPLPAKPELLQETFTPNDPIHGLIHLPQLVKHIVDTRVFQRMRSIKQLGICCLVYPGAVHNRFFHSIGTAYLAYEFVKGLKSRQPELEITDRDILCVMMAGLCHDLGHPCFSHMFEVFIHQLGKNSREQANKKAQESGQPIDAETEKRLTKLEKWSHEDASVKLLKIIFEETAQQLKDAGLCVDEEGDDFACICELIDPPKEDLEKALKEGRLKQDWSKYIKGRPVKKAWLYEIVSNWRSGIDVDKFDYFRRDAYHLGIVKQFDHHRYLKAVCVLPDHHGEEEAMSVLTISPPDKERDALRENMLELRKSLHRTAYQHKTVKKIEMHMIDILMKMDKHVRVTGTDGRRFTMSEAALELDPIAYLKLTDSFVETTLEHNEIEDIKSAVDDYTRRITKRNLMRLVADYDPDPDPEKEVPKASVILDKVLEFYNQYAATIPDTNGDITVVPVRKEELRCEVCSFHYGMKSKDPIKNVLFHNKQRKVAKKLHQENDKTEAYGQPNRQKVFFFWNPETKDEHHEITLKRLTVAFTKWAVEAGTTTGMVMSPARLSSAASPNLVPAESPANPPPIKKQRFLKMKSSCTMEDPF